MHDKLDECPAVRTARVRGFESANLDVLRAIAVLCVYAAHLLQVFGIDRLVGRVTIFDAGQTGVLIFFVHTSLVLMLSLERMSARGGAWVALFYTRRAFRIYPLSVLTVLILMAAQVPPFPTQPWMWPGWRTVAANLTLTQNLTGHASYPSVLWSLPYEIQMYLLLPALFLAVQAAPFVWLPLGLWLADVATAATLVACGRNVPDLIWFAPCFLGGIVGYRLWRLKRRLPFALWPVLIVCTIGLRTAGTATGFTYGPAFAAHAGCLLLGLSAPLFREMPAGWLRWFAGAVARYSYGIYLSHTAVFWLAFVRLSHWPLPARFAICAALSVVAPVALYHLVEKPMMAAGVRLTASPRRAPAIEARADAHLIS